MIHELHVSMKIYLDLYDSDLFDYLGQIASIS